MVKYEYIIAGKYTRGGSLFAVSRQEAEKQVKALLQEGEYIYSLKISR